MMGRFNRFLDVMSDFLAVRKGLLPLLGALLILVNGILQFFPAVGWLGETNLFLHLGIILAIIGFMLAWAL
ncbi:MAG: hypothetical protein EHM41_02465 [Chloroflexi bacterium]|nr:MAG: hypothetical protein EHM41_02465 [Chloroflexota bacterium]